MAYADTTRFHQTRREQPERHHCPACGRGGSQSVYDDGVYDCPCGASWVLVTAGDYDEMDARNED